MYRVGTSSRPHLLVALALTVALALIMAGSAPTLAQGQARLSFSPSCSHPQVDDTFNVDVNIQDIVDLVGVEFHIHFDPQVLEVVDANPMAAGVQITPQDAFWSGQMVVHATNTADNAAGTIDYAVSLVSVPQGIDGSGTLATIRFRVKAQGLSQLAFDPLTAFSDRELRAITVTRLDGHVGVATHQVYLPQARGGH